MAYKPLFKSCKLKCPRCKNVQSINRRLSKLKKPGHRKPLWCPLCRKRTLHTEIKDYID